MNTVWLLIFLATGDRPATVVSSYPTQSACMLAVAEVQVVSLVPIEGGRPYKFHQWPVCIQGTKP